MGVVGFEAIDGFSEKEIYATGWKGEIWQNTGREWIQRDSPTNTILLDICCAGDGYVYICGRNSTLIRGRNEIWEHLELELNNENLWNVAWFKDALYLSTTKTVFKLKK